MKKAGSAYRDTDHPVISTATGIKKISIIFFFLSSFLFLLSCSDDSKKNSDANLLEIEVAGQIGVATANEANAEFTCMIFTDDYSNVKINRMIISEQATSSVEVGESLDLNNESNSATITITSETGVLKTYTIKATKFVPPDFIGNWTFTNECYFEYSYCNDGSDCGWIYYASLSQDDYGTYFVHGDQVYDNTLQMEFGTVDAAGSLNGSYTHGAGADGEPGSFEIVTDGGQTIDLNVNFTRLFPGGGTWKMNPVTNEITFYNSDKSKLSLTYSNKADMVHWQVVIRDDSKTELTIWLNVDRTGMPSDSEAWLQYGYTATAWVLGGYMIGLKMVKD